MTNVAPSPEPKVPPGADPSRRRLLFLVPVLVFVGLVLIFVFGLHGGDPSRIPSALIGKPAPAFALEPLDGLTADGGRPVPGLSSQDLKGKVTVVNVWASWCVPCREEHPLLLDLAHDPSLGPSVRIVGINQKDNPENARRFLGALGNPYAAVGADPKGRTSIDWGVYGVPETFVVGPDGVIRYKQIGPLTPDTLQTLKDQLRQIPRA